MKNITRRIIAFIMMLIMAMSMPIQTLAEDEKKPEYIKEMQIFSQEDYENAIKKAANGDAEKEAELRKEKTWTSDNGYTVINKDVNAGTKEPDVYIGYKTTDKASEAITDTAVMDMKGGYSFTKYEDILKGQEQEISEKVDYLSSIIKEYQKNYKAKSAGAIYAHEQLNLFVDGDVNDKYAGEGEKKDSGQKLGDYFLTDISKEKLTKIVMQSNSLIMNNVYLYFAAALGDSQRKSWPELLENYKTAEKNNTLKDKTKYSVKACDDKATDLMKSVEQLQDILYVYYDAIEDVPLDSTSEVIEDYISDLTKDEKNEFRSSMELYRQLNQYQYGDVTVAEFFTKGKMKKKDIYPLVGVLTDGQFAVAYYAGLQILFSANGLNITDLEKAEEASGATTEANQKVIDAALGEGSLVSIYEGVQRKLFFHGVACTSAQQRAEAVTKDNNNPFYGNCDKVFEMVVIHSVLAAALLAVFSTWYIYSHYGAYHLLVNGKLVGTSVIKQFTTGLEKCFTDITTRVVDTDLVKKATNTGSTNLASTRYFKINAGWTTALAVTMMVEWAYTLGMFSAYLYSELDNYYNPTMTEKPIAMVDYGKDEDNKHVSITYDAVMQYNKDNKDIVADLNANEGKQWNVLYVTKDTNAGSPLTTNFLYKTGEGNAASLNNYTALHYFGQKDAFNLNSHCYNDNAKGIYMFFEHYDETSTAPETGSVFGTGNMVVIFILTGVVTVVIGGLSGFAFGKRKKVKVKSKKEENA